MSPLDDPDDPNQKWCDDTAADHCPLPVLPTRWIAPQRWRGRPKPGLSRPAASRAPSQASDPPGSGTSLAIAPDWDDKQTTSTGTVPQRRTATSTATPTGRPAKR